MLHKTLEAQATTTDRGEFTAIAAAYSVDRTNERILPGAFKGTIARWQESQKQIPLHWDHMGDAKNIIGSVDPASMREIDEGLEVKGQLDLEDSEVAREAWRSMKKNSIGLSFGYLVTADGKAEDGVRELKAVDLFEVSITPAPMNPDTRFIDMKSGNGSVIWEKWAKEHIVEQPEVAATKEALVAQAKELAAEIAAKNKAEETEAKCCETCGHELTAEQAKAIDDARDDEPQEVKSPAQDPLRKQVDEVLVGLATDGIDLSEPPKVKNEKPVSDLSLDEMRTLSYDLMLETLIG